MYEMLGKLCMVVERWRFEWMEFIVSERCGSRRMEKAYSYACKCWYSYTWWSGVGDSG